MSDFTDLLNKKVDDIEKPKPLPAGSWQFMIVGHEFDKSSKKGTPFVRYICRPLQSEDDVDQDALDAFGGMEKATQKNMRLDFYLTEEALFRLTNFLQNTLNLEIAGKSLQEAIPEALQQSFLGEVTHRTSQDGEQTFAEINGNSLAAVE